MMAAALGNCVLAEMEETTLDEVLMCLRVSFNDAGKGAPRAAARSPRGAIATYTAAGEPTGPSVLGQPVKTPKRRPPKLSRPILPVPILDELVGRHLRTTRSATLSVSGRHLPLIYLLVATLISSPHNKAVAIVDLEGRFDVARVLQCTPYLSGQATSEWVTAGGSEAATVTTSPDSGSAVNASVSMADLAHIHVHRPSLGSAGQVAPVRDVVAALEEHMLYGLHGSATREWWGTFVIDKSGSYPSVLSSQAGDAKVDVVGGWNGWLRVEREEIGAFSPGTSAEEALTDRARRMEAVDRAVWHASSAWGGFSFRER